MMSQCGRFFMWRYIQITAMYYIVLIWISPNHAKSQHTLTTYCKFTLCCCCQGYVIEVCNLVISVDLGCQAATQQRMGWFLLSPSRVASSHSLVSLLEKTESDGVCVMYLLCVSLSKQKLFKMIKTTPKNLFCF